MSIVIVTAAELEAKSLAALVETYNDIPGVKPVKKFASKADAIKRIEAAVATQNEVVEDAAVETPEEAVQVEDAADESDEATEEGEASEESPAPGGFKYLTRDELAALAESDPAARQAYRMARRKAARMARKAKKGKAE